MKTYIFAITVAVIVYGSLYNASCVKMVMGRLGTINASLVGGR